jgi:hypothetical protein
VRSLRWVEAGALAEMGGGWCGWSRRRYTWDEDWLFESRAAMQGGQLHDDHMAGMYPYGAPNNGQVVRRP